MLIVFLHFGYEVLRWKDVIAYGTHPLGVFQKWIGANWSSLYSWLYFMLLPLLLAIPYGGTFLEDIKTGYVKNVFTRIGKGERHGNKEVVFALEGYQRGVCTLPETCCTGTFLHVLVTVAKIKGVTIGLFHRITPWKCPAIHGSAA